MVEKECPKIYQCPIFKKGVLFSEQTGQTYKNLYCLKPEKYNKCKRYLVSTKSKLTIPESVMPNSSLEVDEIIEMIKTN